MGRLKKGKAPLADSMEKLKEFFRRHDTNGDGRLNWAELKNAFQRLGVPAPGWRAILALHRADENGDGCISEHELDTLLQYCLDRGYIVAVAHKLC